MEKKSELQWMFDHGKIRNIMRKNRKKEDPFVYVFLDFDGVINVFYLEGTPEYYEMLAKGEFEFADRRCVERINRLHRDFPIRIILSSSWRFSGIPYCTEYLQNAGLDPEIKIYGMTQTEVFHPREEDIVSYLLEHPDFTGFVVLDDIHMKHLQAFEVETDPLKGYTEERDLKCREIISGFFK